MIESAAAAARGGAGFEQPAKDTMQIRTTDLLGRTGRDNTGIFEGGNLSCGAPIQSGVSSTQDCYDRAVARVSAARRPKPSRPRFGNRDAGAQSTQGQRFGGMR